MRRATNKEKADDRLQEIRSRNHENKIRYRKRMQEEEEQDGYLKEILRRMEQGEDE